MWCTHSVLFLFYCAAKSCNRIRLCICNCLGCLPSAGKHKHWRITEACKGQLMSLQSCDLLCSLTVVATSLRMILSLISFVLIEFACCDVFVPGCVG